MGPPDFRQIIANLMIVRLPPEFAINLLPDYYQVAANLLPDFSPIRRQFTTRLLPDLLLSSSPILLPDLSPNSSSILLPDYYQICRQIRRQFFNLL